MVKFSKGMWHAAPDTIIRWATESVKAEAKPESLRTVAVSQYTRNLINDWEFYTN